MIKLIFVFLAVFVLVFGLIGTIMRMSGEARATTAKHVAFAVAVAAISTAILAIVVALF